MDFAQMAASKAIQDSKAQADQMMVMLVTLVAKVEELSKAVSDLAEAKNARKPKE